MHDLPIHIRDAADTDLSAINDIYNHYVLHSTCTYQETPDSLEARSHWLQQHGGLYPVIVATVDNQVRGWGSLSAYHARSAYRRTVENSIYVHHQWQRRGMGALLLQALIQRAAMLDHHAIIAGIDAEQPGSVALHARFGFTHAGHFKQVGYKFGRWLDVIYMELIVGHNDPA